MRGDRRSPAGARWRSAFLHTLKTIVDPRVSACTRATVSTSPERFLIVWGERDPIIPVEHARAAHRLVPASRLEIFPNAGHFPYLDDPVRFVRLLIDFMGTTEPAQVHAGRWGELLRSGGGESAPARAPAAAVPLRRSAKPPAGQGSAG